MSDDKKIKKVLTPPFRISFAHLFTPSSMDGKSDKYQLTMLFPKGADISVLKEEASAAAKAKWGNALPAKLKTPFLNGDDEKYDGYAGTTFIRATSKFQPGVVDASKQAVINERDIVPGFWARATTNAFTWQFRNDKGNIIKEGISFGIQNVQLLPIDFVIQFYKGQKIDYPLVEEPFTSFGGNAEEDFDFVESTSDNPAEYSKTDDDWMD